jgi:hypothetical protein
MGKNYNFNFNPKLPSSDEIDRHKDFGSLLGRFNTERQKRSRQTVIRRLYLTTAAAAAIGLAIVTFTGIFNPSPSAEMTAQSYFSQQEYMAAPLPEITKDDFISFRVEANKGGVFESPSGSRLVVPAMAFADDYGNMIEGEVDIYYREMHDYVDFFLAGLPMSYDSAGVHYQLESAGAIEIFAEKNGEAVKLAGGKGIDIVLASELYLSNVEGEIVPPFLVYQIDTFNRNWVFQDIDQIELLADEILDTNDPLYEYKKELFDRLKDIDQRAVIDMQALDSQYPKPVAPLEPRRAESGRPTLELNFLDGSIEVEDTENGSLQTELSRLQQAYDGVIWQISPNSPAVDPGAFAVEWESVLIRPANRLEYELTLIHPQNQVTIIVSPVLIGTDFERAMSRYRQEEAEYQQALAERENQLSAQKLALEKSVQAQKAAVMDAYKSQLEALKNSGVEFAGKDAYLNKRKVLNRFHASSTGVFNCARVISRGEKKIQADLRNQFGGHYRHHTAYIAPRGSNTLYRYYANGNMPIDVSQHTDYLIWLVTEDNKIAIGKPNVQALAAQDKKEHTIQLSVQNESVDSEQEVRAILQFK